MLRVALITPPFEYSGGIGRLMGYLVAAIDDDKVELLIIDPRGVRQHRPLYSVLPLLRATASLVQLRLTRPPDVVHINISTGGSTIRKCWLILVSKSLGLPTVSHLHASSYPEFFSALPGVAKRLIRWSLGQCDAFLTLGTRWQEFAVNDLGLAAESVQVIRCGVPGPDPSSYRMRGGRMPGEPLHVLFLGRLGERKGTPQLLHALATLAERDIAWRATLAGDGDLGSTRKAAAQLGIDHRVDVLGWVTTEKATELIDDAHVLVLPSFEEGLPVSVLEAFAHGLAVVTTPVGALPDVLVDRENSLVVAPGDVAGLADAIELIARDEDLRARIGEGARRTWQDELSMEICVPRLIEAWEQAAAC
jgi:glycosyltransferase involved in cell wall biosynthesis